MATAIFAIPPALRLTNLGIRQVSAETLEVGMAFGGSRLQITSRKGDKVVAEITS
jgi:glycine betaine/proline transport system permease protein